MKIAIDIDDTLSNTFDPLFAFFGDKLGRRVKREDHKTYLLHETWGCTIEESKEILFDFHDLGHLGEILPLEGALEAVEKLKKINDLYIITSRPIKFKETTLNWIKKHFSISKENIIFAEDILKTSKGKNKAQLCMDLGISLIIEDAAHHALECAEAGIKVILFDNPWNSSVSHKNITRIHSWTQALEVIKKIEKANI